MTLFIFFSFHDFSMTAFFSMTVGTLQLIAAIGVGNLLLLGHCPFGLEVTLFFNGTEVSWKETHATFHPSHGAPRPV